MTDQSARVVANGLLAAAAVGVAYYVLRTPRLRHLAFGVIRTAATTTLPAFLFREVQQAWLASERSA
jgi:hypothetical protein